MRSLAELERRKAFWQQEATEAAKIAADAAKDVARATNDTAEYTKQNARYMLWSVIAILATSSIAAAVNIFAWLFPRIHQ
jgi:hypothetical protein